MYRVFGIKKHSPILIYNYYIIKGSRLQGDFTFQKSRKTKFFSHINCRIVENSTFLTHRWTCIRNFYVKRGDLYANINIVFKIINKKRRFATVNIVETVVTDVFFLIDKMIKKQVGMLSVNC